MMTGMMTWPGTVHTSSLVFTTVHAADGGKVAQIVTITPVFPDGVDSIHRADGTYLTNAPQRRRAPLDLTKWVDTAFPVPVTDQDGWFDPAGNAITGWHYDVTAKAGQTTTQRLVQPLTGQDTILFSSIPGGTSPGEPQVVTIPAVLSVNGQTGNVIVASGPGGSGVDAPTMTAAIGAAIQTHVDAATPHPAYDTIPSLSSYYRNRKAVASS